MPHVGGAILPAGAPSVLIHGMPAARVGDRSKCNGPPDAIVMGESSVLISNSPAARVGDPTSHGGVIVAGCGCVQIGRLAQAIVMQEAAKSGAAFCEECARKKAIEEAKKRKGKKGAESAASRKPAPQVPPSNTARAAGSRATDIDRAIERLNTAAAPHKKGTGWCSRYVVSAINAGGGHVRGANARDLGPNLVEGGFRDVGGRDEYTSGAYQPEAGDVVVFDRVPGHDNGHAAMWNGHQWVSDFPQRRIYAADAYQNGSFRLYRP